MVTIPRIEAEIEVNGRLDEPVWSQAARLGGFSQYQPVDGRPAEERTEVLVWYSPTAIHFGIVAWDRDPRGIRASVSDRDNIGNDDNVTIYLDTFNDRRRAFFFGVNPLGVQDDGVRSEGAGTAAGKFDAAGADAARGVRGALRAVEAAGQDARGGGLAATAGAGKEVGVVDPVLAQCRHQRLRDMFLPDNVRERVRAVPAVKGSCNSHRENLPIGTDIK